LRYEYTRVLNQYACALNEVLLAFLSITHTQVYKYTPAEIDCPALR